MEIKNSGQINPHGNPEDLIFLTRGDVYLKNSSTFSGVIYNPEGHVNLMNSGDIYGADHQVKQPPISCGDYLVWRFAKAFSYRNKN